MNELFNIILKYGFGAKFRRVILFTMLLLILFHTLVLFAPFLGIFTETQTKHIQAFSDSISNISLAIILMFLVTEGYRSFRAMVIMRRRQNYEDIKNQIVKWFFFIGSKTFDQDVVMSEPTETSEILRCFKVKGNYKKMYNVYGFSKQYYKQIEAYCNNVHFELTSYPQEIIYGIHFEFDDYELNKCLYEKLNDELSLSRQSVEFQLDNIIPKKASWIFLTKTISFEGDVINNFAKVLTHNRHFVELVGHCYNTVYSESMLDFYLCLLKERPS